LVINKGAYNIVKHLFGGDNIIVVDVDRKGNTEHARNEIKKQLKKGNNIVAFVEKQSYTRKDLFSVTDSLKKGMFVIASQLDATITPVVLDHVHHSHGIISNRRFNIYVDETRKVKVDEIDIEMSKVRKMFKRKLKLFSLNEI
jgi:choline kinase